VDTYLQILYFQSNKSIVGKNHSWYIFQFSIFFQFRFASLD